MARELATAVSPFARYGLYRNPFGELTVEERAELAVVEVEPLIDWLSASDRAVLQVAGPCGHGKSTHLRALQFAWSARTAARDRPSYLYFPEEGDQPALPRSRPLLIDEAQRMSWWRRRQMLSAAGPLVLGTHRDMARELIAAGFQVRTIDLSQPMSVERLQCALNRRIAASANQRSTQIERFHPLRLSTTQVVALQHRFGSNIRLIEDYLYELFQNFALKGEPWLPV